MSNLTIMRGNGPYVNLLRNALPEMNSGVRNNLNQYTNVKTLQLSVSNPTIAKFLCLPKIHKLRKLKQPIVSAIEGPTFN